MKIVITGFMGSGKTRLARELARRLNLEMVDLDDRVTEREGRSPAQLIVEEGEEAFRLIESDVLCELLETEGAGVIALGGGAWIVDANRQLIDKHDCLTVWLDVPFGLCWARIETSGEDRPLGRTREQAKALFNQRRPIYQLAKIRFEVKGEVDLDSLVTQLDLSRRFRR
jgi:shikimate kinase